jgi:hypothetical protein
LCLAWRWAPTPSTTRETRWGRRRGSDFRGRDALQLPPSRSYALATRATRTLSICQAQLSAPLGERPRARGGAFARARCFGAFTHQAHQAGISCDWLHSSLCVNQSHSLAAGKYHANAPSQHTRSHNAHHPLFNLLQNRLVWPLYWLAQGTMFWALFVVGHDCGHQSFSPSRTLNDFVGNIVHATILVPYHGWRVSHRKHHGVSCMRARASFNGPCSPPYPPPRPPAARHPSLLLCGKTTALQTCTHTPTHTTQPTPSARPPQ